MRISILHLVVILTAFTFGNAAAAVAGGDAAEGGRIYIPDVPFVGFAEAAACDYPSKEFANPAIPAALEMVYRYWGLRCLPEGCDEQDLENYIATESVTHGTFDDLKALVDQRVPPIVILATTPYAHRAYDVFRMTTFLTLGPENTVQQTHMTAGTLYPMAPLEDVCHAVDQGCTIGANDSVISIPRVVVGYDDQRREFLVHDPSLGPNLAISYDDFSAMWRVSENRYSADRPQDWSVRLDTVPREAPRARTPDDDAAVALFYGTALAATGRLPEAEAVFTKGLGQAGISAGREHLLRLEYSVVLAESGHFGRAIKEAKKANDAYPGYFGSWRVLAALQKRKRLGYTAAVKEANELCEPEAQQRAAQELARDFYIMGCETSHVEGDMLVHWTEYLGWGAGSKRSTRRTAAGGGG